MVHGSPFLDGTPVRLEARLTRGELAALLDDPSVLAGGKSAQGYVRARRMASAKLAEQARAQGVIGR